MIKKLSVNGVRIRASLSSKTPIRVGLRVNGVKATVNNQASHTQTSKPAIADVDMQTLKANIITQSYNAKSNLGISVDIIGLADDIPENGKNLFKYFEDKLHCTDYVVFPKDVVLAENMYSQDFVSFSFNREIVDNVTLGDVLSLSVGKVFTDGVALSEVLAKTTSKSFNDASVMSDYLVKTLVKYFTDTLTSVDSLLLSEQALQDHTDVISSADTAAFSITRQVIDNAYSVEIVQKTILKTFVDSLSSADSVQGSISIVSNAVDSVTTNEAWAKTVARAISDSLLMSEVMSKQFEKSFSDSLAAAEAINKTLGRSVADSNTLSEAVLKTSLKNFTDSLSTSESGTIYKDSYFAGDYVSGYYTGSLYSF